MKPDSKWHILYCDAQIRICPISDFIESRPPRHQMKILRFLELLEELGPALTRPYADILRDGIHELRMTLSGAPARFLYFFCFQNFIIFYHAFWKHRKQVPDTLIAQTIRYREELLKRTDPRQLEAMTDESV